MGLIVQKYGGTSMGSTERIAQVAKRVAKWVRAGHQVVVVPSAMSGETNRLLALAKELAPGKLTQDYFREQDMLAATGEQASSALLAQWRTAAPESRVALPHVINALVANGLLVVRGAGETAEYELTHDFLAQRIQLVVLGDRVEEPPDRRHLRVLDLVDGVLDVLGASVIAEDQPTLDQPRDEDARRDPRRPRGQRHDEPLRRHRLTSLDRPRPPAPHRHRRHRPHGPALSRPRRLPGVDEPVRQRLRCCLLYTSPSPRDRTRSRMPSSA